MKVNYLKSIATVTILTIIGFITSCSKGPRTIEEPWINYANTSTIDIDRVELTDTATILTVKANYFPNYWIMIAPETYLEADGKSYAMTNADGIEPGKEFWMPESGKAEFKLFFEPLPFDTKSFDFIEGDSEGTFQLLAIDISGKAPAEYPEGIPSELKKGVKNVSIPDPAFEIGKTTVNFQLCPYIPQLGSEYNMYLSTLSGQQQEYTLRFNEEGRAAVSFEQFGTANATVVGPSGERYAVLTLYPGETIDCYIDSRLSAHQAMANNRGENISKYKTSLHTGRYSEYDRAVSKGFYTGGYRLSNFNGDFADYRMTGDEYLNHVKNIYDAMVDSITKADISKTEKEYHLLGLQNDVISAVTSYKSVLARNYRRVNNAWEESVPADSIRAQLSDSDFREVTGWFDINNPKLLLIDSSLGIINWNEFGVPGDLSKSIEMFVRKSYIAQQLKLTESDLDSLKTLSNPFFAEACDSISKQAARAALEFRNNPLVAPTPDVSNEQLLDAIIAPHKGKVVMIDLWNTWCGPCRAAIKRNEPLKTGELANDDIVWIYIADETSTKEKYLSMITDIRGIHYFLNADQIKTIREQFNVDGIPYYILVDRQGKAEGRPDIRNHDRYIEAIKSKL